MRYFYSKYYAYELTRRFSSEKLERLSQSLCNATVDLNPHQIDAALVAFRLPPCRRAILADEVGLGKTVEAGLIDTCKDDLIAVIEQRLKQQREEVTLLPYDGM